MKKGTVSLLAKAERAIHAAQVLLDAASPEFAVGRVYYAMFYVAEALLHERDQRFGKHSAVHSAYGKEFAKTGLLNPEFHRWLLRAFEARLENDYGFETTTTAEEVTIMLGQAQTYLDAAQEFLTQQKTSS